MKTTPAPRTVPLKDAQQWLRERTAKAYEQLKPLRFVEYGAVVGPAYTSPDCDVVRGVLAAPDGSEQEYHFWYSSISGRVMGRWEKTVRAPRETPSV
ncbi:hypothetical protein SEA_OTTAWA_28 [Arthrobacter phage Ottawa]|nr:hypothetical protein SEA_KHARCHO_28 [Arthrobacter phage Kharcho]WIC89260.1 hypothetical protein SEA_OTTAWA_28 [Arthrobacter phage Ottawa]